MNRITVIDAPKRRFVSQRNRIISITSGNHFVFNLKALLVGHPERHLCARRACFILDSLGAGTVLIRAKQTPTCPIALVYLDRRRNQRTFGVHNVEELEIVAIALKVNRRFVNLDGVFDTVAVGDLFAGLLQHVVLDGDSTTTGFELLVSRLGPGRVFERSRVRGSVEHAALDRRLIREFGVTGIVAERRRRNGEGNSVTVVFHVFGGKRQAISDRRCLASAPKPRMQIVGILHERVLGGIRNIAHAVWKGIHDVQRRTVKLSSSIVFKFAICAHIALLAVGVHRPVDDPCALIGRAVDSAPVEPLVPRHLRLRLGFLDRRRHFLVDNVHNEVRVRPRKAQARRTDRCKVRVPARQCIGCRGIGDESIVLVLEGGLHLVINIYIKVEVSLFSIGRPIAHQLPVGIAHQHGFADSDGNGVHVDTEILRPCRLKRVLHRHCARINRIDDGLQGDARLPLRLASRCGVFAAHESLGDRCDRQLRRKLTVVRTRDKPFALDSRIVVHGVIRTRIVHLGVIDDAVGGVLILKVVRECVGKGVFLWVKIAFFDLGSARFRVALVNREASRIRLLIVQRIGEHVAAHIGLELTLIKYDCPLDIRRRSSAIVLLDHVIAKLICLALATIGNLVVLTPCPVGFVF